MREFLERSKVKKLLDDGWVKGIYPRNDIMLLHKFTDQEIVKPYLDKLKEQILEKFSGLDICEYVDDYDWEENDISHYDSVGSITDILSMIDNILSEQCEEKQKDKCESCFTKKLAKEKWVSAEDCKECKKKKDEKSCDKCVHVNESEPTKHNCATCKDMDNYEEK